MMALLSLVPIILYLVVLRSFDAFSMVRWRTLGYWMAWGAVSAVIMLGIVKVAHATGHSWAAPWVSPVLEEALKVLPLLLFVARRKVVFSAETQFFGEAIGGGFALVENTLYLNSIPDISVATALVRGLGTSLMHMGCTALVATLALLLFRRSKQFLLFTFNPLRVLTFPSLGKVKVNFTLPSLNESSLFPLSLLPSVAIHTFHNTTPVSPMSFMVGMIVVFFVIFYLVSLLGERRVIQWLDVSIGNDIQLIASLREGKLAETNAGQYLAQLRNRFEPLVFFDMCVYVQLYLELLIEAKARVMLRDAGFNHEETPEQAASRKARLTELDALRRRIPRLGLQMLRPIIHATDQDNWALRQ